MITLSSLSRTIPALGLCAVLAACSAPNNSDAGTDAASASCTSSGEQAGVITQMTFLRVNNNVSEGFNLDGRVSMNDPTTCNQDDYTSPDGTPGIDNQAAFLWDAVDGVTNNALAPAVQTAINNGQLLLSVSLQHVDDPMNDPCIDVVFRKVTGTALVGTDGRLTANQTFSVEPMRTASTVHASIVNGVINAGPFELSLPITVLDANFTITVHNALLRLSVAADGSMTGLIGGGISVADIVMIASGLNIGMSTIATIETTIRGVADLDQQNGDCGQISSALSIVTVPAFVNP